MADPWDGSDPEELSRLKDRRLRRQVRHQLYAYSRFYRRVLDEARISAQGFSGVADLSKLPLIGREELARFTEEFLLVPAEAAIQRRGSATQIAEVAVNRLFRGIESADRELGNDYRPVHTLETTGTTSEPLQIQLTRRDLALLSTQGARSLAVAGVGSPDIILSLIEPSSAGGFWPMWLGAVASGTRILAPGVLEPEYSAALATKTGATVLLARADDALMVVEAAGELPDLKTVLLGPEPVSPALRRRLSVELGDHVTVVSAYGFAEGRTLWVECREGSRYPDAGFHSTGFELFEAVNLRTRRPQPEGSLGEVAFTGLDQRGTALARYLPGDVAAGGIRGGRCPYCGRTVDRIIPPVVRRSNILEIQPAGEDPILLDVERVAEAMAHPSVASWRVEVQKLEHDPRGPDEVFVLFKPREGSDAAEVALEIDRAFRVEIGLTPTQLVLSDRSGGVVDLRVSDDRDLL